MPFDAFELQQQDEDGHFHNAYIDFMQSNNNFDNSFIEKKKVKSKKQLSILYDFIGDNDAQVDSGSDT
jgi:hypothetical protein